jgi:hypothetical protein
MKKKTKITYIKKLKQHRTRKHPKRAFATLEIDRGTFDERIILTLPQEATLEKTLIPKETNSLLFWLWKYPVRIIYYLDTEKGFVYDSDKNYAGSFEKHDLKKLYSRIGHLFRCLKKDKRISKVVVEV